MSLNNLFLTVFAVISLPFVAPAIAGSPHLAQAGNGSQQPMQPPTPEQQEAAKKTLPLGEGREELIRVCGGCHVLTVVSSQHKSESAWTDTVVEMRNRGANAPDEEMETIVEYLVKNFGPDPAK